VKTNEAQALIVAAGIYLQRYKGANSALKEAKAALLDHMDAENVNDIAGTDAGSGARIIEKAGNRTLQLADMSDALVLWCARNGVLTGAVGAYDELPDEQRNILAEFVGRGAPSRYVDLYFPSWGASAQAKKETARATSSAAPLPATPAIVAAPTPIRAARANPPTARKAPQRPVQPAQRPEQGEGVLACPDHPNRAPKVSQFNGGFYCTAKTGPDEYCTWTAQEKAS